MVDYVPVCMAYTGIVHLAPSEEGFYFHLFNAFRNIWLIFWFSLCFALCCYRSCGWWNYEWTLRRIHLVGGRNPLGYCPLRGEFRAYAGTVYPSEGDYTEEQDTNIRIVDSIWELLQCDSSFLNCIFGVKYLFKIIVIGDTNLTCFIRISMKESIYIDKLAYEIPIFSFFGILIRCLFI